MKLNSGLITIPIERDDEGVVFTLKLNVNDLTFIDKFYELYTRTKGEIEKYDKEVKKLEENTQVDEYGVPVNAAESLKLATGLCDMLFREIDILFGEGTSKAVFNDIKNPDMLIEFFEGLVPLIEKSREDKINKYAVNREQRRAVMK